MLGQRQDLTGLAASAIEGDDLDVTASSIPSDKSESESKSATKASETSEVAGAKYAFTTTSALSKGHEMGLLAKVIFLFAIIGALVFSFNLRKSNRPAPKSYA